MKCRKVFCIPEKKKNVEKFPLRRDKKANDSRLFKPRIATGFSLTHQIKRNET
jgi:hypothetical protein